MYVDIRAAIEQATGDNVIWQPEPGEYLVGRVISVRTVDTSVGESIVAEVEDEDTDQVVAIFLSAMLRQRFEEYNVQPGDRIAIKYHGKRLGRRGEYKHFTVFVDREERPKRHGHATYQYDEAEVEAEAGAEAEADETPF